MRIAQAQYDERVDRDLFCAMRAGTCSLLRIPLLRGTCFLLSFFCSPTTAGAANYRSALPLLLIVLFSSKSWEGLRCSTTVVGAAGVEDEKEIATAQPQRR